jgi:hypothetical protein
MNRLTAAVEAEVAIIRRAIQEANHRPWMGAKVFVIPAAMVGLVAKFFRAHAGPVPPISTRRHRGVYIWDAGGNFVPLVQDPTSQAPDTRGSETSQQRPID